MRWREVVFDIHTMLQQHYDDPKITLVQTTYWCSVAANRLLSQHIDKRDSGAFLTIYPDLQVLVDSTTNYKYIEIPLNIFDFDKDDGVEYMSYYYAVDDCTPPFTSVRIQRTAPAKSMRLYWTLEEVPTPDNPYFYRAKDRLYLLGLENIAAPKIEAGFYQTIPAYPTLLDDEFPFPDELLSVLQRYVFDFGRFVINMPKDAVNDGSPAEAAAVLPKMTKVSNDVSTQQEE